MIWMLYYVVGFWLSFGLLVLKSAKENETVDVNGVAVEFDEKPSPIFAAVVMAMAWPICLPALAVFKVSSLFRKPETLRSSKIKIEEKGTANHGYTAT